MKPTKKTYSLSKEKKLPAIFTVCDALDCDDCIGNIAIPGCKGDDYGQEIVKIFVAKNEADEFASVAAMAVEANWDERLAISCTGATRDNRIIAVGDVYEGVKPASETETEPAPYGVTELVNMVHSITFSIKRWSDALIDEINLVRCRSSLKFWYLTDTGYLFGGVTGYENSGFIWGHIEHNGPGGGRPKASCSITWKSIDQSVPVYAPFLKSKQNP